MKGDNRIRDEHGRSIRDLKNLRRDIKPNGTKIRQLLTAEIKKLQAIHLRRHLVQPSVAESVLNNVDNALINFMKKAGLMISRSNIV